MASTCNDDAAAAPDGPAPLVLPFVQINFITGEVLPDGYTSSFNCNVLGYTDNKGIEHLKYIPPGRMDQAAKDFDAENWKELAKFDPWSTRAAQNVGTKSVAANIRCVPDSQPRTLANVVLRRIRGDDDDVESCGRRCWRKREIKKGRLRKGQARKIRAKKRRAKTRRVKRRQARKGQSIEKMSE